jgi:hypothetical protein
MATREYAVADIFDGAFSRDVEWVGLGVPATWTGKATALKPHDRPASRSIDVAFGDDVVDLHGSLSVIVFCFVVTSDVRLDWGAVVDLPSYCPCVTGLVWFSCW